MLWEQATKLLKSFQSIDYGTVRAISNIFLTTANIIPIHHFINILCQMVP